MVFLHLEKEKESKIAQITPEDVVIGHVGRTYQQACQKTQKVIAFYPWAGHPDRSENTLFNCLPKEKEFAYLKSARSIILLTSEYNKRCYLEDPKQEWHSYFQKLIREGKRVRVAHQPIDSALFDRVKHTYTTSNFLYIGNNAHMKGLDEAKYLVRTMKRQLFLYGTDGTKLNHLDRRQVEQLPHQADFFIQPGMWEAQCVSILEAASRGFIPIVTPETGYPYTHPFTLRYGDVNYNLNVLKDLLALTPEERQQLADHLYHQLISDSHHNQWDLLSNILVEEVKKLY